MRKPHYPELAYRQSYRKAGVTVVTIPLDMPGYYVKNDDLGPMIFVKSELPRADRTHVISTLLKRAKEEHHAAN